MPASPSITPAPAAESSSSPPPIRDRLTLVITTSPTPSAPSTDLVASVLASFRVHCEPLMGMMTGCRVVVVLDAYDRVLLSGEGQGGGDKRKREGGQVVEEEEEEGEEHDDDDDGAEGKMERSRRENRVAGDEERGQQQQQQQQLVVKSRLKKGWVVEEEAACYDEYKRRVKQLVLREFLGAATGDRERRKGSGENDDDDEYLLLEEEEGEAEYGFDVQDNRVRLRISRARDDDDDARVTFIEPSKRLGFGLAVRSALRLTRTPYVWIQQHDWPLVADIPILSILDVMEAGKKKIEKDEEEGEGHQGGQYGGGGGGDGTSRQPSPPIKYVCFPSVRMLSYATSNHVVKFPVLRELTARLKGNYYNASSDTTSATAARCETPTDTATTATTTTTTRTKAATVSPAPTPTIPLTPLFFWHDKPHVASTAHYVSRVFPTRLAVPRGAFIEDLVGQRARDQMKAGPSNNIIHTAAAVTPSTPSSSPPPHVSSTSPVMDGDEGGNVRGVGRGEGAQDGEGKGGKVEEEEEQKKEEGGKEEEDEGRGWARWACWLYYPDQGTKLCVRHLQGRVWKGIEGQRRRGEWWRERNAAAANAAKAKGAQDENEDRRDDDDFSGDVLWDAMAAEG